MRVISWFSCGAASAVATILSAIKYGQIEAVYCRVVEEHEDNLRFIDDFTQVTGIPVKVIVDEKHQGSIYEVFTKRGFIKNQYGAPCTMILKKDMRKAYQQPNDIQVFGYTVEEQDRANRFIDGNNDVNDDFILIHNKVTKQDCYAHLTKLGLRLPVMYHLGYSNNNCIGCVKGGMGYWNKIRKDFPDRFEKMAKLERLIGHAVNKDESGPVYLDQLEPNRGRFKADMPADCGFTCEVKNA
jgi:3'-phosphoadenosine 5'-phosphosulfate sulfotransferase (PAPS reductase)/FAD synthetase